MKTAPFQMLRIEFLMFIIAMYWKVLSITAVPFIWGMIGTQPNANVSLGSELNLSSCVLFRSTQWDKDNRCFHHQEMEMLKPSRSKVQKLATGFQKFLLNQCSKSHIAFKAMLTCQPTPSWKIEKVGKVVPIPPPSCRGNLFDRTFLCVFPIQAVIFSAHKTALGGKYHWFNYRPIIDRYVSWIYFV